MATEDIVKAANKETAERMKTINSVTGQVGRLRSEVNRKIGDIDKSNKDISKINNKNIAKLSKDMDKVKNDMTRQNSDIKSMSNQKGVREVQSSLNVMLRSLSDSVDYMSKGVKNTSIGTAKITQEAIGQYGKAISEDISINKQNTVAMALAKTTPLFGYFAGKFMETDVYSGFADKIKGKFKDVAKEIGFSLKGVARHGFEKIKDLRYIGRKKELMDMYSDKEPGIGEAAIRESKKARKEAAKIEEKAGKESKKHKAKIPHMQEGGVVKKTGLAKVHKGEVVTSVSDLLEHIDDRVEKRGKEDGSLKSKMVSLISMLTERSVKAETYVGKAEKSKKGLLKDFITSYSKARNEEHFSMQQRQLKAILELKVSLVGMTSRLRLAWQETLMKHPTFRNILAFSNVLKNTFEFPLKFFFTARGGYMSEIRRVTKSKNVFANIVQALSLIYAKWSPKFDSMKMNLIDLADSISGKKKGGREEKEKLTTRWEDLKGFSKRAKKHGVTKSIFGAGKPDDKIGGMFGMYARSLGLDEDALMDAGISGFGGLTDFKGMGKKSGVSDILEGAKKGRNKKRAEAKDRLKELFGFGKKPPHMAAGGAITKTGTIKAHAGEFVVSNKYVKAFIESMQKFQTYVMNLGKAILMRFAISEEKRAAIAEKTAAASKKTITLLGVITWPLRKLVKIGFGVLKFSAKAAWSVAKIVSWPFRLVYKTMKLGLKYSMKTIGLLTKIAFWPVKKIAKGFFKFTKWATKWGAKAIRKIGGWGLKALMFGLGIVKTMFGATAKMGYKALIAIPALLQLLAGSKVLSGTLAAAPAMAGVAGAAWGVKHAKEAMGKSEKWKVHKAAAGIGGFLGGSSDREGSFLKRMGTIASDTAKGTAKGAMIGAGIGSVVPGFGTAIGGAVGALAGGVLGMIGGKNISKGIQYMAKGIVKLAKSVFSLVTWPVRMLWKVIKWAKEKIMKTPGMKWIASKLGKSMPKMDDTEKEMENLFNDQKSPNVQHREYKISKTDLARQQAETEARRINGITGPLLKASNATREQIEKGNAATVAQIAYNTTAVQSTNNSSTNVGGGQIPGTPIDDGTRRMIEGDLQ